MLLVFMITVGGDDYELSYHMFSYTGIAFIASLICYLYLHHSKKK